MVKSILFFIDRYPGYGGIETVTTILTNGFIKKGYSVTILSFKQENNELLEKLNNEVDLYYLPNKTLISEENRIYLINLTIMNNIDVLIHQHSYAPIFDLLVSVKSQLACKIITVEHNTPDAQVKLYSNLLKESKYGTNWKFNIQKLLFPLFIAKCKLKEKRRHRKLYFNSNKYILLSEKFVPVFKNVTRLNTTDKLVWIPNPIEPIKIQTTNNNNERILLYVGRLDKNHKRVDRLMRIFEQLYKKNEDWKLVIVGDGVQKEELEEYVKDKQIQNIYFEGFKLNVTEYYMKAKIICLTSNIEGWPMVLIEAMEYGVIPFSYDSYSSVSDIIDDGVNGFIIPSFKEEIYIDKLKYIMKNEDERKLVSLNAKNKSSLFATENIINSWLNLFSEIE